MRRLVILLVLCAGSAEAALSSLAKPVIPIGSDGVDTGLVRIKCASGGITHHFRGALIDTRVAEASYDVILTVAHGLPADPRALTESCFVVAGEGDPYGIEEVWRPDADGGVTVNDWAVLLTAGRDRSEVKRLSLARVERRIGERLAASELPARLPLLFVGAERECNLTQPTLTGVDLVAGLFVHTCRAWPGHSGSPILIDYGGEPYIVGIHLGNHRPLTVRTAMSIGRYVDAAIADAIDAAIARGRALDGPRRSRRQRMRSTR